MGEIPLLIAVVKRNHASGYNDRKRKRRWAKRNNVRAFTESFCSPMSVTSHRMRSAKLLSHYSSLYLAANAPKSAISRQIRTKFVDAPKVTISCAKFV